MRLSTLAAGLAVLVAALPAAALTTYPDYVGTNVTFTGIQETSTFGDPEPLFGAPTGSGDQLLFFPANFTASAAGLNDLDNTGSQLQATITANTALDVITKLMIDEFGDVLLTGSAGTGGTGASVTLSGDVTVLAMTAGAITPVVIPFSGTYNPSQFFTLPGDAGTTLWDAHVLVDIAGTVPNATQVALSFDNDLFAASQLADNTAKIQKKVASGPAILITVIPEPASAALMGLGLVALAMGRTRRPAR